MTKLMRRIHPNYKIKYNPAPFITSESVPITRSQLDFLKSKGIPIFGFNNQRQCYDMRTHVLRAKNVEKRTLGLEEMNQKYQQILNPPPTTYVPTLAIAMSSSELKEYAGRYKLSVPETPYDADTKKAVRQIVQAHIDANKGAGGGKQRTMKQKMMFKKKRTLKK